MIIGTSQCRHAGCSNPALPMPDYGDDMEVVCLDHTLRGPWPDPMICRDCAGYGWDCTCPVETHCLQCDRPQVVVKSESSEGFAGGTIYWETLACGHLVADMTDDLRAAI